MYGLPSFVLRDIPQYCRVWQVVPFSLTFVKEDAFTSSPVFCTAKYRGGVRRTEGLKRHHINQFISRISLSLCVPVRNIGGVPVGRGG